jgi:hypothetical protein
MHPSDTPRTEPETPSFYGHMSSIRVDVIAEGKETLCRVLVLFKAKPTGFRIEGNRMRLFWQVDSIGDSVKQRPLPADIKPEALAEGCLRWLSTLDYGTPPDHEGTTSKGWRCFNDSYPNGFDRNTMAIIEPAWILLGK